MRTMVFEAMMEFGGRRFGSLDMFARVGSFGLLTGLAVVLGVAVD